MKGIFATLLLLGVNLPTTIAQNIQLRSNGFVSEFKPIDTLHYTEYNMASKSALDIKRQDPTALIHRQSFGKTTKESPKASDGVFYTTKYYAYSNGTLHAPTSQIFFKPVDLAKFENEVKNIGSVERHPFLDGYYFLNLSNKSWLTGEKIFRLCNTLFESKLASVIEPVFVSRIKVENPLRPMQWNIRNNANVLGGMIGADMNVENAWNVGATGTGIRVAVIDDGVDLTHPDLVNNLLPGFDATGNNSGGAPAANNGHGTNCAGIIAATDNTDGVIGVAFNARIIPIRMAIVSPEGFFLNLTETMKATCFNEAVNRGADIISCSWGGGAASAQLNAAIQNAVSNGRNGRGGQGCIVLFSAGNNNASISSEASNQNVIAVGASSTCDTRKRSSNNPALVNPGVSPDPEGVSCDGEGWWGSNFGTGLDVLAPGVWITTTDNVGANGFVAGNFNDRFNGTSAACPNAAAVVALILSVNPNLTGVQARDILEQTCFKIPNGNFQANVAGQPNGTWSNQAGHGRLNAAAAVCRAFETSMSIIGPSLVCSGNNSFSVLNLPAGSNVAWTSNTAGLQLTSGQGTASAIFARQNNFNGQALITAANNSGCGSINLPPLSVWVGNPPADNSTLIWTGVRGTNPVTLNAGSINQYQCDFVPYADSYTWILPRGFVAVGSTTTPSRFISITTTNQIGTYNIFCRANNGACFSWTRSLTVNVVSSGGGGQQMRIAFPNPANNSISVKLKEEDNKEQTEVSLFNKNMERIYYIRTEEKDISISTTNILPGLYYLNIVIGKDITQQQIVISH